MTSNIIEGKRVIVIGGGITGLSACWQLQSQSAVPLHITLIEAEKSLGGKIATERIEQGPDSFIIEGGPESFVTRKPEAWKLAHELGLADQILDAGSETRNIFVVESGQLKAIPLSPIKFLRSDLVSWKGKLRMLQEPFRPARKDEEDESLHQFVSRRLGSEASERMLGPILAGIYNTNPQVQSILVASPVMREMEREHGSLVRGALARMKAARKQEHPKRPAFFTLKEGAQAFIAALEQQLDIEWLLGTGVSRIEKTSDTWIVVTDKGEEYAADAVVIAAPANQAAAMLQGAHEAASEQLSQIRHSHIGTATLVFNKDDVQWPQAMSGLMIPRREQRNIDAITWTSNKSIASYRNPAGYDMLRVFFGGANPDVAEMNAEDIKASLLDELHSLLGVSAEAIHFVHFRWLNAFPQAHVGHLELVDQIEKLLPKGLYVAGASYRGIGVPDCIRQGRRAADKALHSLAT